MFAIRDSKSERLASMLIRVVAGWMVGSLQMIIAYVVDVKPSMSAEYRALRTCIVEKLEEVFEHESLNCLMMFDTFSKRWWSECSSRTACEITRKVARSKSTTSSAWHTRHSRSSCVASVSRFGMSVCTWLGSGLGLGLRLGWELGLGLGLGLG